MTFPSHDAKLTSAQVAALDVLVRVAEKPGGGRVRASKRRSTLEPYPNVNMIAARQLARLKLARLYDRDFERVQIGMPAGSVFSCNYEYEITAAGVTIWSER